MWSSTSSLLVIGTISLVSDESNYVSVRNKIDTKNHLKCQLVSGFEVRPASLLVISTNANKRISDISVV